VDTPELRFLRDEIEALLGSTTVRKSKHAPTISYAEDHGGIPPEDLGKEWLERATEAEPQTSNAEAELGDALDVVPVDPITDAAAFGLEDSTFDEDTEPSVDTKLVQEALRVAGKQ
ncbi:MAG TPA: hypothetical protein VHV51_19425, partial [Polyangiaceae bacterium]|nr:hypothetical protein [Polyangiaceae bacterium]